MSGSLSGRPNIGFYGGVSSTDLVPDLYDVAIGGHAYLLDDASKGDHSESSVPDLNPRGFGFSASDEVAERTLNPDAAWRRSQESWHSGAGQRHLDAADSDRTRFWQSKGVDVWTRWQAGLLPRTSRERQSTEQNLAVLPVGDYLYLADGVELFWTTDLVTWHASGIEATDPSALRPSSICTDGYRVFAALDTQGINMTTRGASVSTDFNTVHVDVVAWAKGRLMAAGHGSIYYVPDSSVPTPLFTHPNPDFHWVGFAEGDAAIYAVGFSGDHSEVYRIGILQDGSGLDQPIHAAPVPDGELVYAVGSYLGFVFLGTSLGVRMCVPLSGGDLRLGPVIETTGPVRCFEGQGRFLWFGWENLDSVATGLGRLDPTVLNIDAPAWATDIMAIDTGPVTSVATWQGRKLFTVAGSGLWREGVVPVDTGYLDTGLITFGIADPKIGIAVQARHEQPFEGEHEVWLAADDGVFNPLGSVLSGSIGANQREGETLELRHVWDSDGQAAPVMRSWTLRVSPAPPTTEMIVVPLHLTAMDRLNNQTEVKRDPKAELAYLKGLRKSRAVTRLQTASQTIPVTMSDYQWLPRTYNPALRCWEGTFVAKLSTVVQ